MADSEGEVDIDCSTAIPVGIIEALLLTVMLALALSLALGLGVTLSTPEPIPPLPLPPLPPLSPVVPELSLVSTVGVTLTRSSTFFKLQPSNTFLLTILLPVSVVFLTTVTRRATPPHICVQQVEYADLIRRMVQYRSVHDGFALLKHKRMHERRRRLGLRRRGVKTTAKWRLWRKRRRQRVTTTGSFHVWVSTFVSMVAVA